MNQVPQSLAEIRARAQHHFTESGCVGVSLITFIGLVFVNEHLEIFDHADAVKRGWTDAL